MSELKQIAAAVRSYRKLGMEYNRIQSAFGKSCQELRRLAGKDRRVFVIDGGEVFVLTSDRFGNFDVSPACGELELQDSPMIQIVCCAAEKIDAIDRGGCPC